MIRVCFFVLVTFLLIVPLSVFGQNDITYSGSSTIGMGVLQKGAVKAFEEKTGIRFASINNIGSGKGIRELILGKVPLAGASRPLKPTEKENGVKGIIIGHDAIGIFVNKNNPVYDLTKDQLKGIFTGKIKNWKKVGGKDLPITPNTEISGQKRATMLVFQEIVMDDLPYADGFKEIDLPRDQINHVANDETGICSVSIGLLSSVEKELRKKVKLVSVDGIVPNTKNIRNHEYLISRPLILATNGAPKGNVREFISFMLSKEGQTFVAKNFVPIRNIK